MKYPRGWEKSIDFKVMKAIDRMFWLRYYGILQSGTLSDEDKLELLQRCCSIRETDSSKRCPFNDPAQTATGYGADYRPTPEDEALLNRLESLKEENKDVIGKLQ